GDRQAAGNGRGQGGEDVDDTLGYRAARHHVAAQDEQRDREDDLLVDAAPHVVDDVGEVALSPDEVHVRGNRKQDDEQRLTQQEQRGEQRDQERGAHSCPSACAGRSTGYAANTK